MAKQLQLGMIAGISVFSVSDGMLRIPRLRRGHISWRHVGRFKLQCIVIATFSSIIH